MTCTHCGQEFTPQRDRQDEPVFLDDAGAICCDDCFDSGTETDTDEDAEPRILNLPDWMAFYV